MFRRKRQAHIVPAPTRPIPVRVVNQPTRADYGRLLSTMLEVNRTQGWLGEDDFDTAYGAMLVYLGVESPAA